MKFKYTKNGNTKIGFGNALESILTSRGIDNTSLFLNLNEGVIEDYNKYDNMQRAVQCLKGHILKGNKICIVVDFDCDGFTSGSEMYLYLRDLYNYLGLEFNVGYTIHSHKTHGLTNEVMVQIEQGGYDLVIVPDAGSENYIEHKTLKDNNIDVIVLDHHPVDKYSDDAIVVNNQLSKNINNKAMTGVGVVYKFNKALDDEFNIKLADKFLDIVAIGMIADSCDLKNLESRYIVLKGLELIENGTNVNKFISTIYKDKKYSMKDKVTIQGVAFYMCPFINCIIRGGSYEDKQLLFKAFIGSDEIFTDKIRGKGLVEMGIEDYMVRVYKRLKKLQDNTVSDGVSLLSNQIENFNLNKQEIMVVNGEELTDRNYNRVIVNKLSEKYQKHCLLLQSVGSEYKGSASGRKNKDIYDLKQWCKDTGLFTLAAGHPQAFGVGIPKDNIGKLYNTIATIPSSDILNYLVDGIFTEKTLNKNAVIDIGKMDRIWGNKLDEPIFAVENLLLDSKNDISIMGKTKNTIKFIYNGIEFIKFKSNEEEYLKMCESQYISVTIIGRFKINEYNNNITAQVLIEDFDYMPTEKKKAFVF